MSAPNNRPDDIVIIGFAAHLPQVADLASWWEGLRTGIEFAHISTDEELLQDGLPPDLLDSPNLVRRRPVIEDAEHFDPELFGYSPREASECDPQQRIFLEVCWRLFEHSGHDPFRDGTACGVFSAAGPAQYLRAVSAYDTGTHFATVVGNERDFISPRVAYKLNLTGPALSITSGCASSLVAIHLAVQSLQAHETDLAIAGGSTIFFPQKGGYLYSPDQINSPDGRCRAFSAEAHGTIHADGAGAVLLRRREDAEADGDTIWGVVLGTAVTNDGADKIGFTAPSMDGEYRAIAEALAVASLEPADIDYIETHGTATQLGDAIEVEAINSALATAPTGSVLLGALKPNIGHTDTAAGVLGVIKVLLALAHEELPPVAALGRVNPNLDLTGPCRINESTTPWRRGKRPRRAGVSAFSIGGTNAHVIIQEPPDLPMPTNRVQPASTWLRFSAHTKAALDQTMRDLADHLDSNPADPKDIAHTLAVGRAQLRHRRTVEIPSHGSVSEAIRQAIQLPATDASPRPLILTFPGQGSQFLSMTGALMSTSSTFATVVHCCSQITHDTTGIDILPLLSSQASSDLENQLASTDHTQPALFAVQVGLLAMLNEWGVVPDCLIGHSLGEFAAAVASGVCSLESAATAVAHRGRLLANSPEGAMAAVTATPEQVSSLCPDIEIAAINSPFQTVITGMRDNIEVAIKRLTANGARCQQIRVARAFHSHLVNEASQHLASLLQTVPFSAPTIPLAWASTATWMEQAPSPADWGSQLRRPVLFADSVSLVRDRFPDAVWAEVGPGRILGDLVSQILPEALTIALLPREEATTADSLAARVWEHALAPRANTSIGRRIPLPGVAMERRLLSGIKGVLAERITPVSATPEPPQGGDPLAVALQVYSDELGVASPRPEVDFFDLGGDSVLAARIAARLRQRYPIRIGPADVMKDPSTPASLAERVIELLTSHIDSLSDEQVAALLDNGQ